ncbi:hypothetical protein LPTSP4_36620 [Leptospira ryugenii]|uniref:Outer membrane protein beta-barrel domain-containing protein n=1 Tax=Leptospira ryugenii TaxID=1917863 RepID=A0A2P2E5I5_9LEPT|nr:hypothetical protein [Leptospira ryugenii]GBF52124.1 hypothetical protein LPTSP4_36620 [Leptospira ryugenii]
MKIKFVIGLILMIFAYKENSAQSFFESQKQYRIQKPLSVNLGLNSVSNYFSVPFIGLTYTFNANHELGFDFINSRFRTSENPIFLPLSQSLLEFNESFIYKRNSGKIFYNYFLFDSPFYFNSTIGVLPSVDNQTQLLGIYQGSSISQEFTYTSSVTKYSSTLYFSPGFGLKLSLENGTFFTLSGGPVFLLNNKSDQYTFIYSSQSQDSFVRSNILFNLPIYQNFFKNEAKAVEAYINFSLGISL